MRPWYDATGVPDRQPDRRLDRRSVIGDAALAMVALTAVLGAWRGPAAALLGAGAVLVGWRRPGLAVGALVLGVVAAQLAAAAWSAVEPDELGPVRTWAEVIGDPEPEERFTRIVLEIDGERFRAQVYGAERRSLARLEAGQLVEVEGERRRLRGRFVRSAQVRHIVGEFDLEWAGDVVAAGALDRAANRVRAAVRSGAEATLDPATAALFTGLVVGDDSRQDDGAVDEFRSAGLSHLTAVSGQNVAFVMAAAGLALKRLPLGWRAVVSVGLIAWFVVLTRAEPSVVRAGTMAGWGVLAAALGRPIRPVRSLALAVLVLVLVDPLLVWSVGFWLSVGATAGVSVIGPVLEPLFGGPAWLAAAVSVTLGAQLGVIVPSLLVFGRLPTLGLLANLLAVPVAGAVMLVGLPTAIVAAAAPPWLAEVVMAPAELGTRWVAAVAHLIAALEPEGLRAVVVWAVQCWLIGLLVRERWHRRPSCVER